VVPVARQALTRDLSGPVRGSSMECGIWRAHRHGCLECIVLLAGTEHMSHPFDNSCNRHPRNTFLLCSLSKTGHKLWKHRLVLTAALMVRLVEQAVLVVLAVAQALKRDLSGPARGSSMECGILQARHRGCLECNVLLAGTEHMFHPFGNICSPCQNSICSSGSCSKKRHKCHSFEQRIPSVLCSLFAPQLG